jgi:predicted permease
MTSRPTHGPSARGPMRPPSRSGPPNLALRLLTWRLPTYQRDTVVGDLTEVFADRVTARRHFNRLWFWAQTIGFTVSFALTPAGRRPSAADSNRPLRAGAVDTLRHDLRDAWRALGRSPGFLAIAVTTLALGIGANVAIFSLVNAVLLQPLPFHQPHQLVRVFDDLDGAGAQDIGMTVPELEDLRRQAGIFEQISGLVPTSTALAGGDRVDRIELLGTSPNYFELLGARAALGHVYGSADWVPGFVDGVVISDGLWKRQFGGDPGVIGRRIRVDEDGYTIIGVMPADFRHPGRTLSGDVDLWAATGFLAAPFPSPPVRNARYLPGAIARLAPGLTLRLAQQRLNAFVTEWQQRYPNDYPQASRWSLRLEPLQRSLVGDVSPMLVVLLVAVGVVLLIVCVNIATLLLARSSGRSREFAIRQAMGASRGRLVRQVLTESVLISLAGGAAALVVLGLARRSLLAMMPADVPRLSEVHTDWRVLAIACGLALATGLICGVTPAIHASAHDPNRDLKEGGRTGSGQSLGQSRARGALVALEVALSVILLTSAGLLIRSFVAAVQQAPGLDPAGLTVGQIWIPVPNHPEVDPYRTFPQRAALARALLLQLGTMPGAVHVALGTSDSIPFLHGPDNPVRFALPDEVAADRQDHVVAFGAASPDYFAVLRTPIRQGRVFTDHDSETAKGVVVVNEAFARKFSPTRSPVGRRWRDGAGRDFEIIGVVGDVRDEGLDVPARAHVYASIFQRSTSSLSVFFRAPAGVTGLGESLARTVHRVDPELPVFGVRTMDELMSTSLARRRFSLALMSVFAIVALFLATLGIYGVMAFVVSQRVQEFGIRSALGARPRDIILIALRPGLILTGIGTVVGLSASVVVTRVMSALLFVVSPEDPLTFATVPAVLGIAVLAACLIPARRATRVSPVQALRS